MSDELKVAALGGVAVFPPHPFENIDSAVLDNILVKLFHLSATLTAN